MHLKRWLTGIIGVPLLVYLILSGPRWIFYGVLFMASGLGVREFLRMTAPGLPPPVKIISAVLIFLLFYFLWRGPLFLAFPVFCTWAMMPLAYFLFSSPALRNRAAEDIGKLSLAVLYVILPLALLILIDRHPRGNLWILFLFTVIFSGDTGAFYFGRLLGRKKLYVSVSPGKTWAGAVGGFSASVISGLLFFHIFHMEGSAPLAGLLGGGLGVAGQIGDLVESMLKRSAGVKDSGRVFPGHGGILDRMDGVLFAIPVLYVYLVWSVP